MVVLPRHLDGQCVAAESAMIPSGCVAPSCIGKRSPIVAYGTLDRVIARGKAGRSPGAAGLRDHLGHQPTAGSGAAGQGGEAQSYALELKL
jgi:hypothetical protein